MPLQFLEIGFHVEFHAIEWHDFQHETQFHGSCSGMNRIFSFYYQSDQTKPYEKGEVGGAYTP